MRTLREETFTLKSTRARYSGDRFLHWSLKQKLHALDCSTGKDNMEIAFDEGRLVVTDKGFNTPANAGKIFIYEIVYRSLASCQASLPSASALMKSRGGDDDDSCGNTQPSDCRSEKFSLRTSITGTSGQYLGSAVDLYGDIMVVSSEDSSGTMYVYQRADADTWDVVQTVPNPDSGSVSKFGVYAVGIDGNNEIMATSVTGAGPSGTPNLYTYDLDSSWYCIVIAMYDLFGDGWSGARLKLSSTTGKTDYLFPRNGYRRGQYQNPTYVRYCPDDWDMSNEFTYIDIEVPHAKDYPYYWEIKWTIYFENTRQWLVVANHATKVRVQFARLHQKLTLDSVRHPYNHTTKCDENCETPLSNLALPTEKKAKRSINKFSMAQSEQGENPSQENFEAETYDISTNPSIGDSIKVPRRSLNLRTAAPSISPAPTFAQTALSLDYPWMTLEDSTQTGWFKGEDTGTEWYLSTGDGMKLLGKGTLCEATLEKTCKLVSKFIF